MSSSIVFWNIKGKASNVDVIADLAEKFSADLVCLCEAENIADSVLSSKFSTISKGSSSYGVIHRNLKNGGLVVIGRVWVNIKSVHDFDHYSVIEFDQPGLDGVVLVPLHFPSQLRYDLKSLYDKIKIVCSNLNYEFGLFKREKVVFVGDFNINPFEDAMISVAGFNACLYDEVVIHKQCERSFSGDKFRFLYNPMIRLANISGIPGTYFFSGSESQNYYWNIFDQFIVSPDLIGKIDYSNTRIIHDNAIVDLLDKNKKPNNKIASDHLPIVISLII